MACLMLRLATSISKGRPRALTVCPSRLNPGGRPVVCVLLTRPRRSFVLSALMPAKAFSNTHDYDTSAAEPVPLSQLRPKPCLTCGREITPRAKWSKNWDSIRTCSDSCKAQRPGLSRNRARWRAAVGAEERLKEGIKRQGDGSDEGLVGVVLSAMGTSGTAWRTPVRDMLSLQRVDPLDGSQSDASDSRTPEILLDCSLDIDAWIERTLFELASRGEGASGTGGLDKSSKGKKKGGQQHHHGKTVVTCEDAEMAVTEDARLLLAAFSVFGSTGQQARKEDEDDRSGRVRPSSSQTDISESPSTTTAKDDIKPDQEVQQQNQDLAHPLRRALDANPGLRERVRRAARRLAMLDPSLWAISASGTSASDGHLSDVDGKRLELWNDGRRMESLSDVSHAKGTIGIRLVPLLS